MWKWKSVSIGIKNTLELGTVYIPIQLYTFQETWGPLHRKKYWIIWEFFPIRGEGGLLNPKTFAIKKNPLYHLKIILKPP